MSKRAININDAIKTAEGKLEVLRRERKKIDEKIENLNAHKSEVIQKEKRLEGFIASQRKLLEDPNS